MELAVVHNSIGVDSWTIVARVIARAEELKVKLLEFEFEELVEFDDVLLACKILLEFTEVKAVTFMLLSVDIK